MSLYEIMLRLKKSMEERSWEQVGSLVEDLKECDETSVESDEGDEEESEEGDEKESSEEEKEEKCSKAPKRGPQSFRRGRGQ